MGLLLMVAGSAPAWRHRLAWLLLLCSFLWQPANGGAPIVFTKAGDTGVTTRAEVAQANLLVYGNFEVRSIGDIGVVVQTLVGKICMPADWTTTTPYTTSVFQDILSYGTGQTGLNFTITILPPASGGYLCVQKFLTVGHGPDKPPFDAVPAPPIRTLLQMALKNYQMTASLDPSFWTIYMMNIMCDTMDVVVPQGQPLTSTLVTPTSGPMCMGEAVIVPVPGPDAFKTPVGVCSFAADPCLCAAISGCGWVVQAAGGFACETKQPVPLVPQVSCTACPFQSFCKPDPNLICAQSQTPCACIASTAKCRWDQTYKVCLYIQTPDDPPTNCSACARQAFCQLPTVIQVRPTDYPTMGGKTGWLINVTFDRPMMWAGNGVTSGVQLVCIGAFAPKFDIAYSDMILNNELLTINIFNVPNDKLRDCNLNIASTAMTDMDFIPFDGITGGDFKFLFTLRDHVPPYVIAFDPPNSQTGLDPSNVTANITFSEPIFQGSDAAQLYVALTVLGSTEQSRYADIRLTAISMTSTTRVSLNDNVMSIDLSGLLDYDRLYAISIPKGAVMDKALNQFGGLDVTKYSLRTGVVTSVIVSPGSTAGQIIGGVIGIGVFIAAVSAGVILWRMRRANKRLNTVAPEELDDEAPKPEFRHEELDISNQKLNRFHEEAAVVTQTMSFFGSISTREVVSPTALVQQPQGSPKKQRPAFSLSGQGFGAQPSVGQAHHEPGSPLRPSNVRLKRGTTGASVAPASLRVGQTASLALADR